MKLRSIPTSVSLALVTIACANAPSSEPGSSGGIAHPTGAGDLLLRVDYEGGLLPPGLGFSSLPTFSMYGDGTIIRPGAQIEIYPQPALPAIEHVMVDEPGIQAILAAAIDAGLRDDVDYSDLAHATVADAPTTVFTLRVDGTTHTVRVYALAEMPDRGPGMSQEEFDARGRLLDLTARLGLLQEWLPEGAVGASTGYVGSGARVYVSARPAHTDLKEPAIDWPLAEPLAGFGAPTELPDTRCGVVTGGAWIDSLLPAVRTANQLTPWTDAGRRFGLVVRPLLPDERAC
jgi:hypothetical protein